MCWAEESKQTLHGDLLRSGRIIRFYLTCNTSWWNAMITNMTNQKM
jgi:hypothetical protein